MSNIKPKLLDFEERDPLIPLGYEMIWLGFGSALTIISWKLGMVAVGIMLFGGLAGSVAYNRHRNREKA